jgi:signal transduction histidine kinase
MKNIWNKISYLGITDELDANETRNFILANKLNFILLLFTVLLSIVTTIFREMFHGEFSIHSKKILLLSLICIVNLLFSYKHLLKLVRFNLIIFPSLIGIFLPIFLGYVQEIDFYIAPLVILAFSLFPAMILKPDFKSFSYLFFFLYFLVQALCIDTALDYFSNTELVLTKEIYHFHFYFKLIFVTVLMFIYLVIYYYRRLNLNYDIQLKQKNDALQSSLEELKSTQEHLIETEKMASLGVLTAGIAHEINNPLNFIMGGYVGLQNYFNDSDTNKDENIPILLSSIKTGVDRASDIVKGLNQFSRNNDTLLETCDIHAIITNCLVILNTETFDRIEIKKEFSNDDIKITGNVGKLHQVFINILSNSIHAIEKHGVITIKTATQENTISIEITDTGCGISKENILKISDPFFTTKEPGKGTGLGLSIAFRIIQDHKGKISFQSELQKGTTVKIILPI